MNVRIFHICPSTIIYWWFFSYHTDNKILIVSATQVWDIMHKHVNDENVHVPYSQNISRAKILMG